MLRERSGVVVSRDTFVLSELVDIIFGGGSVRDNNGRS